MTICFYYYIDISMSKILKYLTMNVLKNIITISYFPTVTFYVANNFYVLFIFICCIFLLLLVIMFQLM